MRWEWVSFLTLLPLSCCAHRPSHPLAIGGCFPLALAFGKSGTGVPVRQQSLVALLPLLTFRSYFILI